MTERVREEVVNKALEKAAEALVRSNYAESLEKVGKSKRLRESTRRAFRRLKDRIFGKKKLLIVGGGEIATEIGIAALNTEEWNVRCIVSQDPSQREGLVSLEETRVPIVNLPFYSDEPPKSSMHCTTIAESDPFVRFQYVPVTSLHEIDSIAQYIVKESPDIVLLEDMFLTADEWINLNQIVSKASKSQKKIHFVPSPNKLCKSGKYRQSDIFLNKVVMKKFLGQIGESERLLDASEDGEDAIVNCSELIQELEEVRAGRRVAEATKEYERIRKALMRHGKVVLKPSSTSSGHGQFILSQASELDPKSLSKTMNKSLEFVKKHRTKNKQYLLERYLGNKTEVCGIVASLSARKRTVMNRIYYAKYDMERITYDRFEGLTRLEQSQTRTGRDQLWTELNGIVQRIANNLAVSFLYVEFILDNEHKDSHGRPRIFINELSHRPDDAGFVTLLSHQTDQFSLFIKSLDALVKGNFVSNSQEDVYTKIIDTYICKTINPEKAVRFYKDALSFDFPTLVTKDRIKIRLYEKLLAESDDTIDYGRIIGYIWHHSSESDEKAWELFGALKRAMGEEGLNILRRALETRKISGTSRLKETIVVSDWEGPWVTADHAYEVVKAGIPEGHRLFAAISEYDDYLSYIRRKEGYEPGDTLALIAPFLIAFDLDRRFLIEVAKENANFIAGSLNAIKSLKNHGYPLRIISTSYCEYVWLTTAHAGIPHADVRCTKFPIDNYRLRIADEDKRLVRKKVSEIIKLEELGIDASTSEQELPARAHKVIKTMDDFFWNDLPGTSFGPVLSTVKPLGGRRKCDALLEILESENRSFERTVVIGDSITDWVMLSRTRDRGGLAVSFNGNSYAVKNSNVALISDDCRIIPVLVDLFEKVGIKGIARVAKNWSKETLEKEVAQGTLNQELFESLSRSWSQNRPQQAYWVTEENTEQVIRLSEAFRKHVRGSAVGALG